MADYGEDIKADARLAEGAYGGQEVKGYTIDSSLSSPDRTAYVDSDGNLIMAFRGTNLKDPSQRWRDIGTDILLGLGLQNASSRFKNSKRDVDRAIEKYSKDKVRLVGHSMGGSIAIDLSNKRGLPATAFNAGISPIDTVRNRTYNKARSYRTANDLVSGLSSKVRGLKTTVVKGRGHGLAGFM